MKKYNVRPFETVIATTCAIIQKGNKILLTKRNIFPEKGKWCLPGGHIGIGETASKSLKREVKEETGLELKKAKFIKYYDEFLPKLKTSAILLVFTGEIKGKEKTNNEVIEMKWFTKDEINNLDIAFYHKNIIIELLNPSVRKRKENLYGLSDD